MNKQQLEARDYILLIDKSGSMSTKDVNGKSRWEAAQEITLAVARKCSEYDQDGITVIPFNSGFKTYNNVKGEDSVVEKIFTENEPTASTDTAKVMKHVLDEYFTAKAKGSAKPISVFCVTDGTPDNQSELSKVIIDATKKMDKDEEIGISFLQIGNDNNATKFLRELDDDLQKQGAKFDIVDAKTQDEIANTTITQLIIDGLED
jgi:uncharacterized protein YegL